MMKSIGFAILLLILLASYVVADWIETNEEGRKFLEENAKKEGVITLPSGVQYRKEIEGYGTNVPLPFCPMTVRNHIKTLDGDVVESPNEAYNMRLKDFWLPAMREVLALLVEGDEVEIWMPAEQGYKVLPEGNENVELGDVLVVHMQVVEHESRKPNHVKSLLKCDPITKEECNERELLYAKNIYKAMKNHPKALHGEAKRLTRHFFEPDKIDSKESHNWNERKINILKRLGEFEEKRLEESGPHLEF